MKKWDKLIAQEHKERGKSLFAKNNFVQALIEYKKASKVQKQPEKKSIILMNIGICFYNLNLLESYLEFAQSAYKQNLNYIKAQFHRIKGSILLGKLQTAEDLLKQKLSIAKEDIKSLEHLIKNMRTAKEKGYETSQNWLSALQSGNLEFSYVSDLIQVRKSKYGLGIFARQAIPEYQIIVAERPLVFIRKSQELFSNLSEKGEMVNMIKQLMSTNSQFQRKFKTISTKKSQSLSLQQRQARKTLSDEQIREAISLNWFEASQFVSAMKGQQEGISLGSGLYEHISLFNHSCQRSCEFFFIGEWMLVRTLYPIKKDGEIFINYFYEQQQPERRRKLKQVWNIQCNCKFCVEQRAMDQGKLKPDPSRVKSRELQLHLISSQMFFNGFHPALSYFLLMNPQMRWRNVLNYHNQNQLKAKMIAKMFKSPQLEKKFVALFEKNKDMKFEGFQLIQSLRRMKS